MYYTVGSLYDGGWRASDREELKKEYDLTEDEVKRICRGLKELEESKLKEEERK